MSHSYKNLPTIRFAATRRAPQTAEQQKASGVDVFSPKRIIDPDGLRYAHFHISPTVNQSSGVFRWVGDNGGSMSVHQYSGQPPDDVPMNGKMTFYVDSPYLEINMLNSVWSKASAEKRYTKHVRIIPITSLEAMIYSPGRPIHYDARLSMRIFPNRIDTLKLSTGDIATVGPFTAETGLARQVVRFAKTGRLSDLQITLKPFNDHMIFPHVSSTRIIMIMDDDLSSPSYDHQRQFGYGPTKTEECSMIDLLDTSLESNPYAKVVDRFWLPESIRLGGPAPMEPHLLDLGAGVRDRFSRIPHLHPSSAASSSAVPSSAVPSSAVPSSAVPSFAASFPALPSSAGASTYADQTGHKSAASNTTGSGTAPGSKAAGKAKAIDTALTQTAAPSSSALETSTADPAVKTSAATPTAAPAAAAPAVKTSTATPAASGSIASPPLFPPDQVFAPGESWSNDEPPSSAHGLAHSMSGISLISMSASQSTSASTTLSAEKITLEFIIDESEQDAFSTLAKRLKAQLVFLPPSAAYPADKAVITVSRSKISAFFHYMFKFFKSRSMGPTMMRLHSSAAKAIYGNTQIFYVESGDVSQGDSWERTDGMNSMPNTVLCSLDTHLDDTDAMLEFTLDTLAPHW